jgi:hypothetical protein
MHLFRAFIGGGLFLLVGSLIVGGTMSVRGGSVVISISASALAFVVGGLMGVICSSIGLTLPARKSK